MSFTSKTWIKLFVFTLKRLWFGYQEGKSPTVPSDVYEVRIKPSRMTKETSRTLRTEKICALVPRFKLSLELQRIFFRAYYCLGVGKKIMELRPVQLRDPSCIVLFFKSVAVHYKVTCEGTIHLCIHMSIECIITGKYTHQIKNGLHENYRKQFAVAGSLYCTIY